mgnify:CR=1 FL=1
MLPRRPNFHTSADVSVAAVDKPVAVRDDDDLSFERNGRRHSRVSERCHVVGNVIGLGERMGCGRDIERCPVVLVADHRIIGADHRIIGELRYWKLCRLMMGSDLAINRCGLDVLRTWARRSRTVLYDRGMSPRWQWHVGR